MSWEGRGGKGLRFPPCTGADPNSQDAIGFLVLGAADPGGPKGASHSAQILTSASFLSRRSYDSAPRALRLAAFSGTPPPPLPSCCEHLRLSRNPEDEGENTLGWASGLYSSPNFTNLLCDGILFPPRASISVCK